MNINRLDTLNIDYRLYPIRMDYAKMKPNHVSTSKNSVCNLSSTQTNEGGYNVNFNTNSFIICKIIMMRNQVLLSIKK